MSDKKWQFYSFLSNFHKVFNFFESFSQISVKTYALFLCSYCWDTYIFLIVPADAVIPDINGALGVGLPACCYWLQNFWKSPCFCWLLNCDDSPVVTFITAVAIEYRTGEFEKLADYWIADQSLRLSDYQISDSQNKQLLTSAQINN